jgi:hypothetical protein
MVPCKVGAKVEKEAEGRQQWENNFKFLSEGDHGVIKALIGRNTCFLLFISVGSGRSLHGVEQLERESGHSVQCKV